MLLVLLLGSEAFGDIRNPNIGQLVSVMEMAGSA